MKTAEFVIALFVLLLVMSMVGEPYGTWLAGVILLGALYVDQKNNGNESLLSSFLKPANS